MNARRLSYLKNAGASAALEIARQDVLADIYIHQKHIFISLSTLDMLAQCVSNFGTINHVDMPVCASCDTRDPDDPYSREVILRQSLHIILIMLMQNDYKHITCDYLGYRKNHKKT